MRPERVEMSAPTSALETLRFVAHKLKERGYNFGAILVMNGKPYVLAKKDHTELWVGIGINPPKMTAGINACLKVQELEEIAYDLIGDEEIRWDVAVGRSFFALEVTSPTYLFEGVHLKLENGMEVNIFIRHATREEIAKTAQMALEEFEKIRSLRLGYI